MTKLFKIFIICVCLALFCNLWAQSPGNSVQRGKSPLRIEVDNNGDAYYWLNNYALDFDIADYSDLFETYMTPIEGWAFDDCTQLFIDGKLQLEPNFLTNYSRYDGNSYNGPADGILGNDFKRIEIYFYPNAVMSDSVTYSVHGRTKVKNNICDFTGKVKIKKIYCIYDRDYSDYYFAIIADYTLKENSTQNGSGEFRGIMGAYGYVTNEVPNVILVDNRDDVADGYMNRSYVGTWRSYQDSSLVKRCVWGDYRLPFSLDFDVGDGEMVVNSKYSSPEWDALKQGKDYDFTELPNGNYRVTYKNPWW